MRRLNHVEQKLLKKVNLSNFKNERTVDINYVIGKFGLSGAKEYRQYNNLAVDIQRLATLLVKLPEENSRRKDTSARLIRRLQLLGVVAEKCDIDVLLKMSVSRLCSRRLASVLVQLKMAQHTLHAIDLVTHGHIMVNNVRAKDPAALIPVALEKTITWANGSTYKKAIASFKDAADDFLLQGC